VGDLAGAEIIAVGGRPVAEVAGRARELIGADNSSAAKDRLWAFHNAPLMKGLGYASANGELVIQARLTGGAVVHRTLSPARTRHQSFPADDATFTWQFRPEVFGLPFGADSDWVTAFRGLRTSAFQTPDTARPIHLTDRLPFSARAIPAQGAYYMRMNYVSDTDFIPFVRRVLSEVDAVRPRHLIIDWRQNFGGDGSKLQDMTREFVKRADDPPWVNLYVLTGPKTFSAAVMALDALLDHIPAVVIGEPSAAGLNHFGDPERRSYGRTGLRLSVSTRWWQFSHSEDLSEFVPVQIPAPFTFADFMAGRDPAVDPILGGRDMRSVSAIAVADGGGAAARVFAERLARFSRYSWWSPPAEYELRQSCDALRAKGRINDALATCQLNADIHPDVWNVWYNLATVQKEAGQAKNRLASYRCVIAIAPDNWNVPAIRQFLAQPGNEGAELPVGCPVER
jgi:hypothetical protein